MSQIPERLAACNIYGEGELLIGVNGEIELPDFEAVTAEIAGPGILGSIENPNPGQFGSLATTVSFRTISGDSAKLSEPRAHTLTVRGNQTAYDPVAGAHMHRALKIVVRGLPKSFSAGKLKNGEVTETKVTLELSYVKIAEEGVTLLELDKYNYIYIVNGVDYMAEVRKNI